ncbi:MAG TPA: transaldolase [Chloroflexota bacterium]|nr:transaldolase [Chloroflexota bacterium]
MISNPLRELERCGQSVWTDVLNRHMLDSGTLARYVNEDGISGVTANPTIFEKAIVGTHDYDHTIRDYAARGCTPAQIYEALAIADVGAAADLLRPVYDASDGTDGFVSIEVSPDLAHDTPGTIAEARRFWSELGRPNIMIKVPATPAGLPAIAQLIAEGINVNITLIFAVAVHEQVMDAYLSGLERRLAQQQPIERVASVASFFVSRVDTLVDALLDEKGKDADEPMRRHLQSLKGKAAIANAKIAYANFEQVFASSRFTAVAKRGARVQRPLWASTSTKNPAYADTLYVTPLIGPHTVNTMTLETIEAFRDHGVVDCGALRQGMTEARQVMADLQSAGIDMTAVTDQLTREGVEKFSKSLHALLDTIAERRGALVGA